MKLLAQLNQTVIQAPLSLRYVKRNSVLWCSAYLVFGFLVFSLFSWVLIENQDRIKFAILDYFFPKSWHELSEELGMFFFESQAKIVLGNLILSGSLVFSSIFLFPIKEKYSAAFELDGGFNNSPIQEFSLVMQALEESKLFLLYLTVQLIILWIGYYPYYWANITSIFLSYAFLFFTFGLDFISPTLQRHKIKYTLILKVLSKNLVAVMLFGLLFSWPSLLLSYYVFTQEDITLIEIASILFLANIVFLALAVPVGTHLASTLLPEAKATIEPARSIKLKVYLIGLLVLVVMLFLHGRLISSLHHKSQLLKAQYAIDWSSFRYDVPSFSDFFEGEVLSKLSFDVEISNPTEYDIVIEKSQIIIDKSELHIATIDLSGFSVPSGVSKMVSVNFDSNSDVSKITEFEGILDNWHINIQFDLIAGIPFVVNVSD